MAERRGPRWAEDDGFGHEPSGARRGASSVPRPSSFAASPDAILTRLHPVVSDMAHKLSQVVHILRRVIAAVLHLAQRRFDPADTLDQLLLHDLAELSRTPAENDGVGGGPGRDPSPSTTWMCLRSATLLTKYSARALYPSAQTNWAIQAASSGDIDLSARNCIRFVVIR